MEDKGPLTTAEILQAANSEAYRGICDECVGGDSFVAAANQLVEMGLVTKQLRKGGYHWQRTGVSA
ncbi:MAG: hypothetical protein QXS20_00940 [Candidatus Thorarchaeota archaeon]